MQPGAPQSGSPRREPRSPGRARQRQMAREARRQASHERQPDESPWSEPELSFDWQRISAWLAGTRYRLQASVCDFFTKITVGRAVLIGITLIGLVLLFSVVSIYASNSVLPGVSVGGIALGGLSENDAITVLSEGWANRQITLRDGERTWQISPIDLGIYIDAAASARQALEYGRTRGGLSDMIGASLSGVALEPAVGIDVARARDGLMRYATLVEIPAQHATVRLQGVIATHINAVPGRCLDVTRLLVGLTMDPAAAVVGGIIDLPMRAIQPQVADATPLVEFAQALLQHPLTIEAYDPVDDETYPFVVQPSQWGPWLDTRLTYHRTGPRLYLTLDQAPVRAYLEQQEATLPHPLTLDIEDGVRAVQETVETGVLNTWVTVRYLPTIYTVQGGETAYRISRTTGIPFYLIEQANPDRDLSELYVGDEIVLPSRDIMLPLRPVRGKRIVVDLGDQHLQAFENGQIVFDWAISSGIDTAPTSAGVFQILSHEEVAFGSSFALCDENEDATYSCGQWRMHWFMGLYEAVPGLMNGFHGAVELPDGRYLGGGNVGRPFTFGCIMSLEENAIALYNWAEEGVVVEIRQ